MAIVAFATAAMALALGEHSLAGSEPSNSLLQGDRSAFRGTIARIDATQAERMTGASWRSGCPVSLRDLRVLSVSHWGFDRKARAGRLIVHEDVARPVLGAFRELYAERFPIRKIVPVDAYGASDFRSIEADNTSAFNCRFVEGTRRWSEHAYGRALDINPIENPYVSGGRTSHRASAPYIDRGRRRPGMAHEGGALVRAFDAIGWGWGGRWTSVRDYQHFSASGN
ncbi:MAG: M15 family metallopeptidase [Actinobacteria bacterium]|nr:M15 family metallopeptidase [Actinomycetota bacterium]